MNALWFSGGKDSLACLYLLEKEWANVIVLWANTGKNFPEVLETVEMVRCLVPNFVEVKTDRDGQNFRNGLPSQLVPVNCTVPGILATGKQSSTLVQPMIQCCFENIAQPLWRWCSENNIKTIYNGQRLEESYKNQLRDGDAYCGFEIKHPIENWSKDDVMNYLSSKMERLPDHLKFEHTSMDCFDCTAFLEHSKDRIDYMRKNHPEKFDIFASRFNSLTSVINAELRHFQI